MPFALALALIQAPMPFVSPMFSDNMVLQRDASDPIWGWTSPGDHVTIQIGSQTAYATAGRDGRWMTRVGPFKAGGPYTVTVQGAQKATFQNVLFGDVWICSGQSNMEFGIGNGLNAKDEIAAANYPNIRLFYVGKKTAMNPESLTVGDWKICTPDAMATDGSWNGFSAVAYFFGRKLHQDLKVPIGLIHTSWGGTPAEAWTDEKTLAAEVPDYVPQIQKLREYRRGATSDPYTPWYHRNDGGSQGPLSWSDPGLDDTTWSTIPVPGFFQQAGKPELVNQQSVVWFRTDVTLPDELAGKDLVIHFMADDDDATWINGTKVGETRGYNLPRAYKFTAKAGKNSIAVRVTDNYAPGGIYGPAEGLFIEVPGAASIPLAGTWKYKLGAVMKASDPFPTALQDNPNFPTVLYNGMIEPVAPFGVKGAIWYQGESNADRAYQYRTLLPAMISSWRKRFGSSFPFLIVQLAGFGAMPANPGDDAWGELREAQYLTATQVPKAGIATAIDIGDSGDIHPKNKQEVGRRLALVAESKVYRKKLEYSGPVYKGMSIDGSAVRIAFDHTTGGLKQRGDGPLRYFAIAGADHRWVWADAKIEGNSVVVSSPQVAHPVAARYSWAAYSESNLVNGEGLPAFPFRTDDWKGITQK